MAGRLLDTNAVIAFQKRAPTIVKLVVESDVLLCLPVIGELLYGARNSGRATANLRQVADFVDGNIVLPMTLNTAEIYGSIRYQLKVNGRPIPENDMWIAAVAIENRIALVTADRHFNVIDGRQTLGW